MPPSFFYIIKYVRLPLLLIVQIEVLIRFVHNTYFISLFDIILVINSLIAKTKMFKLASYDPKLSKLNTNLIKMKYIINKALTEIRYEEHHFKGTSQKRSQTSSQAESIEQILSRLSRGYKIMKHSINTKLPHPKIIYLSKDLKELCWKNPESNSEKSIPLTSITRVVRENCALHVHKTSEIKDSSCCFVVVSTQRNLEIQAENELEAVVLSEQIRRATSYAKSLCQNYKYTLE